ncbi:hypothetical protein [Pseudomonas folii]|uniref:Uncharacterized protein n=1 Tax=Pseudomonas folii TaxID=2762593 RepID=A0ABR7B5R3_9PSED|nr:hypothetical protein [Pseudomonas folii]MBC3952521.1 hypothetical protein [Pseudomonas folii]
MSHLKIKPGIWILDNLGLLFFHNGRGCLKLNKAWYLSSFSDEETAIEILTKFPDFFEPATIAEGLESYEKGKVSFITTPQS